MALDVQRRVGARRHHPEPFVPGMGESRLREPRGNLAPAERRRREGVLDVQHVAAALVDELGDVSLHTEEEAAAAGLVLDGGRHGPTLAGPKRARKPPLTSRGWECYARPV